jgi:HemY protein
LAAQAQALTPDLAAPAAHHARVLLQDHRTGPAAKVIERAWRTIPHPDLAQVYGAIHDRAPPLDRLKRFERLAAQNPDARETHLAVAEAALDAQLWGQARRHLDRALSAPAPPFIARLPNPASFSVTPAPDENRSLAGPTPRLCLMMARLEEAEHGIGPGSREWLDRAVTATPDPRYVCATCGGESLEWRSLCPHCGSFDALAWRTPAWAAASSTLPILAKPASAEEREMPAEHSAGG